MDRNASSGKINILVILSLVWLAWFIGNLCAVFYIKKWQLDVCLWPEKISKKFVIASFLLIVALFGLGIVAISEEHKLSLSDIFSNM
ncbi:MAG: hypothetical protein ACOX4R_03510 [Lentihominibacter sp.]|jgi:hypothetical protein